MKLVARDLTVGVASVQVCRELNLSLTPGQCWALLGRNGVGKTTLLHTLAGLRRPDGGRVLLDGENLHAMAARGRARRLGLMLQEAHDPFPATVLETALLGRHPHLSRWALEGEEDRRLAEEALAAVDLADFAPRQVQSLSGGERQRLALATLLTQSPPFMLLDEPFNHLDLHHQVGVAEILPRLAGEGRALMLVSHDVNLAARCCDHGLFLFGDGRWQAGPLAEMLREELLSELYQHPIGRVESPDGPWFRPR